MSNAAAGFQQVNDDEYLNEHDHYFFDNEKHIKVGNGGKHRTKTDHVDNTRNKSSENTRKICTNLQNFESKRSHVAK
jgi:hypothetical protein